MGGPLGGSLDGRSTGGLIGWEVHWGTAEQGNLSDDRFTLGSSDETSTGELMRCKMHWGVEGSAM